MEKIKSGRPAAFRMIHHVDRATIDRMYREYSPVFLLSTGRSGSKFLANLLALSPNTAAFHEPRPTLQYFSDYAFHHQEEKAILTNMIDVARMESILEIFIKDKIYVESNQCLSFFAPVIAERFKKAKFVHVIRHPGDFVRSALRKGWHRNDSIWEAGRVKIADKKQWEGMDQIEKLAWVWVTTNRFIDFFKEAIAPSRSLTLTFEALVSDIDAVERLMEFTGGGAIDTVKIGEMQSARVNELYIHPGEPPNMKKVVDFPRYTDWDREMKAKLMRIAADLASTYGYRL
jgi:hypothetical protein